MNRKRTFSWCFRHHVTGMAGLIGVLIIVLAGLIGPLFIAFPQGYTADILLPPSAGHLLGTDNLGLDILAEIIWGARTSLYVSIIAVLISLLVGVPFGLICGSSKGSLRGIMDSIIDIFLTLPILPLMIIMAAIMGASINNVAIVIGLFSWPQLARVTRNAALKTVEMQYIEAAESLGLSKSKILFEHVLLNSTGPVFVNLTLIMASAVLSESSLSFLGLGDPSTWSWGLILKRAWSSNAVIDTPNPWWWWLIPSLCVVFFVVCFNMLGTAINDILNPKNRA